MMPTRTMTHDHTPLCMIMQRVYRSGRAGQNEGVAAGDHEESTKGALLVAVPLLDEPTFHRTVIYMLQHTDEGALGVIINRPTEEEHLPALDSWGDEVSQPQAVFDGGPGQAHRRIAGGAVSMTLDSDAFAPLDEGLGTVGLAQLPDDIAEG